MRRAALPFVLIAGLLPLTLAACNEGYSPNTYASSAAQEEAGVERGVIVGVRQVQIAADGTIGAAAGGAAGGAAGAQLSGAPVVTTLGAIGGTLAGGIAGTAAAQAVGKIKGWEYIVQETSDKLVSVTQTSKTPLNVGLHVLVIAGNQQARIVPDYTVQTAAAPAPTKPPPPPTAPPATTLEINISPALPAAGPTATPPVVTVTSDPPPSAPPPPPAKP